MSPHSTVELRSPATFHHVPPLTASFSIFQPSSYHIVVNTIFGLRLQIQLVPVMQLFVTLDQAAQGQVQGEWFSPVLSLKKPHEGPISPHTGPQSLPNPVLAL